MLLIYSGMSETGPDDPDPSDPKAPARPSMEGNRAQQLFGHRSGASPWEQAAPQQPARDGAATAQPSAPYPRDATYTPRVTPPEPPPEPEPDPAAPTPIIDPLDEDGELTRLHPNYKLLMRINTLIVGVVLVIATVIAEAALKNGGVPIPFGIISVPALAFAAFLVIRIPYSRFNARGYQISADRLRVVRGVLWRSDTVVPFGRVQHIDVDQGPIERALDIATLTLHTAGSHNASVSLPGLGHELAVQMREEIRAHIKRESL